ncbi:MAG TPA: ParB/RepB/Spo0J family partition protein [Clostridia bacterium]|nr:ParB/RepB/Spo0J family partition protein [Clostridia bacterium]
MASKERKLSLTSYDDLFQSSDSRDTEQREQIVELPLKQLHPFKNHPFRVRDDEAMTRTVESVKEYGVLTPGIARPLPKGGYEIVAGHRRKHACELAGLATMPFIVRDMDDDTATILMCDSNLQRENILPSERAFAYKMKLEAMKHQGSRADLTCAQVGHKLSGVKSRDILAEQMGESKNQISRYIRLTELTPEFLQMVDDKKIAFNPAVEMSYLKPEEQSKLLIVMAAQEATPSLSQAQRLKRYSQEGKLSEDVMDAIMSEEKKEVDRITLTSDKLKQYFPKSFTPRQMEETIFKLLEQWQQKRERDMER